MTTTTIEPSKIPAHSKSTTELAIWLEGLSQGDRVYHNDYDNFRVAAQRLRELDSQLADAKQVANDCRIVADNAIAEAKKNQWQPIETAPKDGTVICLWNPKEPNLSKFGKWARHLSTGDFHWTSPKSISYSNLPTHWIPLPKPPTAMQGEKQ